MQPSLTPALLAPAHTHTGQVQGGHHRHRQVRRARRPWTPPLTATAHCAVPTLRRPSHALPHRRHGDPDQGGAAGRHDMLRQRSAAPSAHRRTRARLQATCAISARQATRPISHSPALHPVVLHRPTHRRRPDVGREERCGARLHAQDRRGAAAVWVYRRRGGQDSFRPPHASLARPHKASPTPAPSHRRATRPSRRRPSSMRSRRGWSWRRGPGRERARLPRMACLAHPPNQ